MEKNLDLKNAPISKLFFSFAIPTTFSMLVMSIYTIADGIFITRGVGSAGIAAVNIGYPIINFTVALSLMFGIGGATLIAFEKDDIEYQNKCFSHIILLNIVIYLVVAFLIFTFSDKIMYAMGANKELLPMIKGYMYPCTIAVFFLMMSMSLNAVVRNDNAPKRAMYSMFLGAGLNIFLDYLFIFKFNMGIVGGAVATGISQVVAATYLCTHFIHSTFRFKMNLKILDFNMIWRILSIGFPSFILEFAYAVVTILLNISFMNMAGIFGTAAYSIACYSFMFFRMLFTGLSQGIQPIVSYNYGIRDIKRVNSTFAFSQKFCFAMACLSFIVIYFSSHSSAMLYTNDKALVKECTKGLILYSSAIVFLGFNLVDIAFLQAIDDTKNSLFISLSRSIIFVILGLLTLPRILGINGIWLALPFADVVTAMLTIIFYRQVFNKILKGSD